jgi:hypothetical protein
MTNHPNRHQIDGMSVTAFTSKVAYGYIKYNDGLGLDTTLDALTKHVDFVLAGRGYTRPTSNTNFYIWSLRKQGLIARTGKALFRPTDSVRRVAA